ncbi:hypothetical protein [Candidatus Poriferisodalis sp.]|uniref:hypothetical protein n=1 Tax=Candidatus Poriferisodalis sp. TaxID=3101277 RepID=UPI003B5C195B
MTTTTLESMVLADAELKTSAPSSWGRGVAGSWGRGARLRDGSTPSPATPDDADNHVEAPPCSEVAFPVDTGQELVWESFDSSSGGSPHAGVPDPAPVSDGRHKIAALYLPRHPSDPQELLIVHTNDEGTAAVHTVRLGATESLHPLLRTSSDVGDIVVTPERWFIPVTVMTHLDPRQLIPGDIDLRAVEVHNIDDHWSELQRLPGLTLVGYYEGAEDERLPFKCFASWEQMGVTSELFSELYFKYGYNIMSAGPYPRIDQMFGYILTAQWGEEPVRTELPGNRGPCCKIDVLDTGFVAISGVIPSRQGYWPENAPPVHFSSDGLVWEAVEVPTRYFMYDGEPRWEIPIWVCSAESAEAGGVIIRQDHGSWTHRDCSRATYWTADGDLTNWRKLLAPPPGYG